MLFSFEKHEVVYIVLNLLSHRPSMVVVYSFIFPLSSCTPSSLSMRSDSISQLAVLGDMDDNDEDFEDDEDDDEGEDEDEDARDEGTEKPDGDVDELAAALGAVSV